MLGLWRLFRHGLYLQEAHSEGADRQVCEKRPVQLRETSLRKYPLSHFCPRLPPPTYAQSTPLCFYYQGSSSLISLNTYSHFIFELQSVFFSWRIIALQCCADFCPMTTQISHNYIYIPSLWSLLSPILIRICGN